MMIPSIPPEQRQELIKSLVAVGVPYQRASVITDLACQGAEEAMAALWRKVEIAPDPAAMLSAYEIALQLLSATATALTGRIHQMADASGAPCRAVEVEIGGKLVAKPS